MKGEFPWVVKDKASYLAAAQQMEATIGIAVSPTTATVTATTEGMPGLSKVEEPVEVTQRSGICSYCCH